MIQMLCEPQAAVQVQVKECGMDAVTSARSCSATCCNALRLSESAWGVRLSPFDTTVPACSCASLLGHWKLGGNPVINGFTGFTMMAG